MAKIILLVYVSQVQLPVQWEVNNVTFLESTWRAWTQYKNTALVKRKPEENLMNSNVLGLFELNYAMFERLFHSGSEYVMNFQTSYTLACLLYDIRIMADEKDLTLKTDQNVQVKMVKPSLELMLSHT